MDWNRPKNAGFPDIYPIQKLVREKTREEDFVVKANPFQFFFFLVYNMSSKKALIDSYLGGLLFLLFFLASLINNKKGKSSKNVLHHTNYLS